MGIHIVKPEGHEFGKCTTASHSGAQYREELLNKALEDASTKWVKTDLRRKNRVDVKVAGVVFEPEDSKETTMNALGSQLQSLHATPRPYLPELLENALSYISQRDPV